MELDTGQWQSSCLDGDDFIGPRLGAQGMGEFCIWMDFWGEEKVWS